MPLSCYESPWPYWNSKGKTIADDKRIYLFCIKLHSTSIILYHHHSDPERNRPWDVPELSWEQQIIVKETIFLKHLVVKDNDDNDHSTNNNNNILQLAHDETGGVDDPASAERTVLDEACRTPHALALRLRSIILQQKGNTTMYDHPCNEETKLLDCVGDFLKAFGSLQVIMTTPHPFPLVQMTSKSL
jgi:hypothetical protein